MAPTDLQLRPARTTGLTFAEVVVAVVVIALCSIPLLWVLTSSRTDTSKAINYLRAVELANEAIEWASIAPFHRRTTTNVMVEQISGSLVTQVGSGFQPAPIDVVPASHSEWVAENLTAPSLTYSSQYTSAFFYRTVKVEDVVNGPKGYLRRVTVTVEWAEGRVPQHHTQPGGERNKKIVMSTLILNEKQLVY